MEGKKKNGREVHQKCGVHQPEGFKNKLACAHAVFIMPRQCHRSFLFTCQIVKNLSTVETTVGYATRGFVKLSTEFKPARRRGLLIIVPD